MTPSAEHTGRPRAARTLRLGAWGCIVSLALLRALVSVEPFPFWESDPTRIVAPLTGLTPLASQIVDVAIIAAAGAALLAEAMLGLTVSILWTILVLAGAAAVGLHSVVLRGGSFEHMRIGSTWIAAMASGLAGMHVCRDAGLRRITLAVVLGLVVMLAAKGAVQVFVEHPQTVAAYRADREGFLSGQGWSPDSISARNFERRLFQPEAAGWFGLSNVYATFAAAGTVGLVGWALLAWRQRRDPRHPIPDGWAGVLTLGAAAALVALWLARSKGGHAAAAIGLALLAGRVLLARHANVFRRLTPRIGGVLALALMASAILALVIRGALGELMGELSLLFRWFYVETACRVFADHTWTGVGPAGFRDAYMLAKPAISPEEVQSPHSVLFDFASTLGVLGLAWGATWLGWIYRVGSAVIRDEPVSGGAGRNAPGSRSETWAAALMILAPVMLASWIERAMGTPEMAIMRLVGVGGWLGVTIAALSVMRCAPGWGWVTALAALAAAVHGQVEVTPVWGGAACLVAILITGSGAGGPPTAWRGRLAPGIILLLIAAGWSWTVIGPIGRWQSALVAAADRVAQLAEFNSRLTALATARGSPTPGDSMSAVARDLGATLGIPAPIDGPTLNAAMDRLTAERTRQAAVELSRGELDHHFPTVEAICRMHLASAAASTRLGRTDEAAASLGEATKWADLAAAWTPRSASALGLLGNTWATRAQAERKPDLNAHAIQAWTEAALLDPHGMTFPLRIFKTHVEVGNREGAKHWAARLLELDANQRLDPLKQLTESERKQVEAALRDP